MSELLTHSMLIHPTQVKKARMCLTILRSSTRQEAWTHTTWRFGKPVVSYLPPKPIMPKKPPWDQLLLLRQVRKNLSSSVPWASEIWDTLLKPEAKQDLGVVHSEGISRENRHFETVTQSRDAEFGAEGFCDKTSSQFANEVLRGCILMRACTQFLHTLMQKGNSVEHT